jgi:REDY-like protein HapK
VAQRVFFLNRLREGADPADYERWVREVDYPLARRLPTIRSYVVTRLDGLVDGDGEPPYDYLEVVEITELEAYRLSLSPGSSPELQAFGEEWSSFVGESLAVYGEVLE